ncbi:phosphomannomutase/phosphoglucomutase, partial [Reinekea sp.]|uniref:phosphomannomutase/phosphoglucomutase n=1 Tax=Reinekea sp. TaxID=1970455 RepID=UPI002A7F0C4F
GTGNKGILFFLYLPIVFVALAIAAAGYVLLITQVDPVNQRHRAALVGSIAAQYEAYVNNVLDQHNALLDQIANSAEVIEHIGRGSDQQLADAELRIASQLSAGLSVHLFPLRAATVQATSTPPLSHAALDMIRRVEQGQSLHIEAHQHQGIVYLQAVKAVRNEAGLLIGTLAAAQSLAFLSQQLGGIDDIKGSLVIQQQFDGGPVQTLVTYGTTNGNELLRLRSHNPNWTLTYQAADDLAYSTIISPGFFWLVFAVLILLSILSIVLGSQKIQQVMRQDASSFAREIQDLLLGQQTARVDFQLAIFVTLAKTINRMRMGKSSTLALATAKNAALLESGKTGPIMAETQQNFDIAMIESDTDLLGMNSAPNNQDRIDVAERLFHTWGIGGIMQQTLNLDAAVQIGLAIGSEAGERNEQTVIVGRDGRLSSADLAQALTRGLVASGQHVIDVGVVPTPVCYFACERLNIGSCVMITGSHRAADYNGFKVMIAGNTLIDDEIKGLYHRIARQHYRTGRGHITTQDLAPAYLTRISEDVQAVRPLKVVIDCGNGVAGAIAPQLIKAIGCHVLPLYCDVDGNFPNHLPDPADARTLQDLTLTVVETRADLGLAFDGDGDRLAVVTNSGKLILADRLLMLLAKQVLLASPGATVLFDVQSSRWLKNLILGSGGKPLMWKTGPCFMSRKMKQSRAALAGEMSGHFFYQHRWYGFDDALYTACRLIEILAGQEETLDALMRELPVDVETPELTIVSSDERKFRVIEALQRNAQFPGGQMSDIDGVRVDFEDGWGLVRASNTAAKLTCRFAANNEETLHNIQAIFKQQLLAVDSQLQIPF